MSSDSSPKAPASVGKTHTLGELKALMEELEISPKKSLGQNFLVSALVIHKIHLRVTSQKQAEFLEVGPGLGALTHGLPRPLTVIEMDRRLSEYWRNQEDVKVVEGDALKVDWSDLALPFPSLLVSNLPYQISSSLVIDRSVQPAGLSRMILMFQKEVAQRIQASPSQADYGLLSVIAQTFWQVEFVLEAGPKDFFPPPKVASRVLEFRRREAEFSEERARRYLKMVKCAFSQRRKVVWKNLASWSDKSLQAADALGLSRTLRAENLSVEDYLKLFDWLDGSSD